MLSQMAVSPFLKLSDIPLHNSMIYFSLHPSTEMG
jgi:hypothetical protein